MKKLHTDQILNVLLYAGAVYFHGIAPVHGTGMKNPGLFVSYSVPSFDYQEIRLHVDSSRAYFLLVGSGASFPKASL